MRDVEILRLLTPAKIRNNEKLLTLKKANRDNIFIVERDYDGNLCLTFRWYNLENGDQSLGGYPVYADTFQRDFDRMVDQELDYLERNVY